MIHLGVMNNLPFTVDEITNTEPKDFSTLAYSMSQGRGPNRAKSQTNEMRLNNTTWQTLSLTSSNASFYEKLGIHKASPDGELMRLIEYQIEPSDIIDPHIAKQMFDHQLMENYGLAGDIYCNHLVGNLEESVSGLLAVQAKIDREMRLTNRERFWSSTIASIITGGLISRNLNLHDYDMKAIYQWAVNDMLRDIRQDVAPPVSDVSGVIGSYVNRYMQNMLVVNDEVDQRTKMNTLPLMEPKGPLLIRYEPDTNKLFLAANEFRKDCVEAQIHYKDILKQLKAKGIYLGAAVKRRSKGMKMTTPGVYALMFDCANSDFITMSNMLPTGDDSADRGG
jgi:hypothetical protein